VGAGDPHGPRALRMVLLAIITNMQKDSSGVLHCLL
jgi:hypothetical protein